MSIIKMKPSSVLAIFDNYLNFIRKPNKQCKDVTNKIEKESMYKIVPCQENLLLSL